MTFVNAQPARTTIADRQNQDWSITLLAAQRQLYSELKRWRAVRIWAAIGAATVGLLATLFAPTLLVFVGPLAAVCAIGQWIGNVVSVSKQKPLQLSRSSSIQRFCLCRGTQRWVDLWTTRT